MADKKQMGLREKQYIKRWNLIHTTTLELVEANGMGITVNQIISHLGVSARTFFNYFPTKEDAVLGVKPATVSEDQKLMYLSGDAPYDGNVLEALANLYFEILYSSADLVNLPKISKLVHKYPELLQHRFINIYQCEELAHSLLKERLNILSSVNDINDKSLDYVQESDGTYIIALVSCCGRKYLRDLRLGVFSDTGFNECREYFLKILMEILNTAKKYS